MFKNEDKKLCSLGWIISAITKNTLKQGGGVEGDNDDGSHIGVDQNVCKIYI